MGFDESGVDMVASGLCKPEEYVFRIKGGRVLREPDGFNMQVLSWASRLFVSEECVGLF